MKAAAVVACGLALCGCKTQITTQVNLSDLDDPEALEAPGKVRLEVSSCADYQDSRQPSDSLVKAQEMLPRIFPAAEYRECYRQEMNSWAEFDLPVAIDHTSGDGPTSEDTINLASSEGYPLSLYVPEALSQRLEEAKRSNPMMGSLDMSVRIEVNNDTEQARSVQVFGAWVDGAPYVLGQIELEPGAEHAFYLSDVSIDQAMKHQYAAVLKAP
ncbi:hypothetical protein CVH10_01505 [Halomonas sp. ND22Bw]|uniref:DUF7424 family protein n=1 Tax=Halomonas sp. ND22Bw TaxID=2054178 RepID=UPI000D0B7270|nr:hypothetical protein CVH10_01505 [Halomonas sp. ND22Bw]